MQVGGVVGVIKSIQRGTILTSTGISTNTATIAAVNTAKTVINFLGVNTSATTFGDANHWLVLTNATTLTALRAGNSTGYCSVSYEVVEYY